MQEREVYGNRVKKVTRKITKAEEGGGKKGYFGAVNLKGRVEGSSVTIQNRSKNKQ